MSTSPSPFIDHAANALQAEPALSDEQRADLHDVFHESKSPDELVQKLMPMVDIPDDTKHRLWQAKQASMPVAGPTDKVTAAIQRMTTLDPKTLELAEAHPNVMKAFTSAATAPEKDATASSGASSGSGKGTKTPKASAVPTAPRLDGQPHFPAIPDGHHRILSGNGAVYDIPQENIESARALDPSLQDRKSTRLNS